LLQTIRGWARNALDAASLPLGEPVTLVFVALLIGAAIWGGRGRTWPATRWIGYGLFGVWLLATLGITIYPIKDNTDLNIRERWEIQSVIPLSGTIESFGNMRDRTMSPDELAALRQQIAVDLEIPESEVNLDPRVRGISLSTALRDPLGNLLLFVPFGLVAPLALRLRDWRRVAGAAAAISGTIELSQLMFGLGSLGSIDDVIFNTAGALVGFATWPAATSAVQSVRRRISLP
jgi:hypothetical protein